MSQIPVQPGDEKFKTIDCVKGKGYILQLGDLLFD